MKYLLLALISASLWATSLTSTADDQAALWTKLQQGGYVILMRHALAPGTGDPRHFKVDDCSTQRNLSERGRTQAQQIGAVFKQRNIPIGEVFSSAWCRCKDTAALAFGDYQVWEGVSSFWQDRSQAAVKTEQLRQKVVQPPAQGNTVFVTHFINIIELTGEGTSSGEMVVLKPQPPNAYQMVGQLLVKSPN